MSKSFFAEIKRCNVIRFAGLYLVGAWLLMQVAGTLLPVFDAPTWVMKTLVGVLAVGLVPALIFSWVFELTPEGLKRDEDVSPAESITPQTARRMDRMIIAVLLLGLGYFGFDKFVLAPRREAVLVATAEKSVAARPVPESTSAISDKSVAVLAFANLSDDKANEYFSDGISEELLNVLCKVPGLKVTARTSAFYFKGKQLPMAEIAQQLGVAFLVEGSVRKAGDQVRITAQLIKVADGFHVWSDTFTRELKDVFAVQDEIAGLIAKNLSLRLDASSTTGAASVNAQAFELYVQARQAWNLRNAEGFARAEQLLSRVLELAPDFARAHAALADVWYLQVTTQSITGTFGRPDPPEFDRVLAKIRQALAIDPQSAEAHASLGNVLFSTWKFAEAEREYRHAIELNPNYASAHQWLAANLGFAGRMDEALAEMKLAGELDPLSSRIADNNAFLLFLAGQYSSALAMYDRVIVLQSTNYQAVCMKSVLLAYLGRIEEAVTRSRQFPQAFAYTPSYQSIVDAKAGLRQETEAVLPATRGRVEWDQSYPWVALGSKEEAIAALDPRSCDSPGIFLAIDYDLLGDDPRFQKFLATIGWTEQWNRMKAWRAAHPPERPETVKSIHAGRGSPNTGVTKRS